MIVRLRRAAAALAVAALVGSPGGGTARDAGPAARAKIVAAARRQLGHRFAGDCSAFVLSLMAQARVPLRLRPARSRSESIFLASRAVKAPRPGDLAFFHDTYDRDRDGRANDPFTHVAVVERVKGKVVLLVHRGSRGVERIRMDVSRPSDHRTNDPVRPRRARDPSSTRVLAGELFAGFAAVPAG